MKKISAILILILSLVFFAGCHSHAYSTEWSSDAKQHWHGATCHDDEKIDVALHTWAKNGTDVENNAIYACSICGYVHQHAYDTENWEYNGFSHWHPIACEHGDAPLTEEEHTADAEGLCTVCGATVAEDGYEVAFAYYVVNENGSPVVDSNGSYTEIGVTYTNEERNGSTAVDTVKGTVLEYGDKFSFSVTKSIFCYYTDGAESPLVEIIYENENGEKAREVIYPDENGIYTVEVKSDIIVSVANVLTNPRTITGKGTQEDPFTINSLVDWLYFAMYVNDKSYYSLEYNLGYWKLNADLDFEGESIYVIGDGFSSENSVFCGNFDGNGHKLSNFVLENNISSTAGSGYANYLGLFGVSTGYVGVDSVIANLTLENVTVNATANNDDIVSVGCILGYGVGANIRNCTVRNAQINVIADDKYMSFAGGMVGYMQSGMTEDGMLFYSSVGYSVAENVSIKGTGMLYSAGGIAGRVVSYNDQVTSFILNSYSSGNISDAVRSGGIAGDLLRYSTVQNSYSTANVSAYSTIKSDVDAEFEGTAYDDRYAYAGGVVGYAENDTVVEGCFFDGSTHAAALAGNVYGKAGNVVAGYSNAQFADYYANATVLNNPSDNTVIDNGYLQNTLHWHEADWTFGEGYPTINQTESERTFTIKINIDGIDKHSISINSQYLPLSYWYILDNSGTVAQQTISKYYQQGTNRTYGYYFDSQCTQEVPVGYVPMKDMTLYAKYADVSEIAGDYYVYNNGVSAELKIDEEGSFTYEEGVVLLQGVYSYDGKVVAFDKSYFSRLASTATVAQKANYYTFWAEKQENGNLHLFDCDTIYEVSEDNEEQNSSFTAMARFYTTENPLVIISYSNLSFTGGYYYSEADTKHVFEFNNDYTGVYKKYSGENIYTDSFTFQQENTSLLISLKTNGARFTASVEAGKLVEMVDNRENTYALSEVDAFAGTWEKSATSHKIYNFDGMGKWTYEHYVYLAGNNLVNATKKIVSQDSGDYTIDGSGNLIFIRQGISVVATLENDGSIAVSENGQPVQVSFTNLNSYKGVWYTANNKITRYTLTLEGLNGKDVGTATLDGFEIEPLKLRYTAVASDTLYLYVNDIVYATLKYFTKTGLFEGMFYDSQTGTTTTPQTLYLYDDFSGAWVSDIDSIPNLKFNGFGAYNTKDESGNSLAVQGLVTIGADTVGYTVDKELEKAEFTYKGVKYTLVYNEYANAISVSYGDESGIIAKADSYAGVTLYNLQGSYQFDGRGNFTQGGTVISNNVSGNYTIQANGNILMKFAGQEDKTIVVTTEEGIIKSYSLDATPLYVENTFSGTWSIPSKNVSIVVGTLTYVPAFGQTAEIQGQYDGNAVTMYYNGIDTVSFEYEGVKYSLYNTLGGNVSALILKETVTIKTEVTTESIVVRQDEVFGVWTRSDNDKYVLTFDGCGDSYYVSNGTVTEKQQYSSRNLSYKIVEGVVTVYDAKGNVYATFEECEKEGGNYVNTSGAYVNGGRYYQLIIK